MSEQQKNVLGENLEECSNNPLTGWLRDGCCNTDKNDRGVHVSGNAKILLPENSKGD